ncbi:phage late control D family protein [Sphaerisporangium corydalis]|uniref:Phage late control D family protein n=1 Tax=Sphaerisporangium corydalis TaxID=1441875 RepID=A0ABV9E7V6_9ACTN|nr:contractile injection system protein, VgrG/Pvc8 family [Sphaerisporangium corydalis]
MTTSGMVPGIDIRVDGARLPLDARIDIESVTVVDDLSALSMFAVVLYNWDQDRLKVTWSDSPLFALGAEVQIALGPAGAPEKVITGEVTSLEPAFGPDRPPMLTVRGYDLRHRLARGRKTRTFSKVKDSAIVRTVARGAGLRAEVSDSGPVFDYVLQHDQTDLEFLRARAGLIGHEVYVRDKVLYFRPPQHTRPAVATLHVGQDLTEFTPRLRSLSQVDEVTVRGWDAGTKSAVVATADSGQATAMGGGTPGPRRTRRAFGASGTAQVDVPVESKARADDMARGLFQEMALSFVQGEAVCSGRPGLRAGTVVDVQGAGETFSGTYYLTCVTHTVAPGEGYLTSMNMRRNSA